MVAVRVLSQLIGDFDELQVLPLNAERPLFARPQTTKAIQRRDLMEKHLGAASKLSHYTGVVA